MTLFFKKGGRNSKENYRPVSILSNISKIFERCMFCQISSFMDSSYLSKQQCGLRKCYTPHNCLLMMLEKRKSAAGKGKCFWALLAVLSKAFYSLSHELPIATLYAYGFDLPALKPIQSYLSNRKQRTKTNVTYSSWEKILSGVLGP